jgi:hypothetical protein
MEVERNVGPAAGTGVFLPCSYCGVCKTQSDLSQRPNPRPLPPVAAFCFSSPTPLTVIDQRLLATRTHTEYPLFL